MHLCNGLADCGPLQLAAAQRGLVVAMLVTPAATASLAARRLPQVIVWAGVQGVAAAIVGIYLSYYVNIPAGPAIVLVNTTAFGLTLLFVPRSRRLGV